MEDPFKNNQIEARPSLKDVTRFGQSLLQSRTLSGKNIKNIMLELGEKNLIVLQKWEEGENFPKEEKVPAIADAYGIDRYELIRIFKISKEARQKEKDVRRRLKLY